MKAISNGELDNDVVRFSNVSSRTLTFDARADHSRSYTITSTGTTSAGESQTIYTLLVYASVGRVSYAFSIQSSAPVDSPDVLSLMSQLTVRAAAKVKQQP